MSRRAAILVLDGLILLLGIVLARSLTLGITKPLHTAVTVSRKVAEGDTGNLGDISTLLDPAVVQEIIDKSKQL